ncbi:MAG: hypothetical protein Ct9H90mP4_12670 [Gammaproteobacteria bacterium]|nr:MAG: hypothetical protein Ct9H90mP4_12670 [Gammaproteobacteria bacterium]
MVFSAESILRYKERIHPEIGKEFMVVTQNFHATEVGYEILKKGVMLLMLLPL